MPKIKQLSQEEAQKIAAGQIVERPASVIKELVENAIDAHATTIAIYCVDAGKKTMRVVDNGCGMDEVDAQLCFAKHATSKISSLDDLNSLVTFGFRGEALASIAAVSRVTLHTKMIDMLQGCQVTVVDGKISLQASAVNSGTDITIDDLFYNTPARKRFLKTTQTEWRAIVHLFYAFCFAYPSIHFKLFNDGQLFLNCPSVATSAVRCAQLLPQIPAEHIISIHKQRDDKSIEVHGIITNHQYNTYDRSQIFLLVNNRWVKNYKLSNAVLKGYQNVLPQGKFPCAAIIINIEPSLVDINVHPRKEEVVFANPRIVEQLIEDAIASALESKVNRGGVVPARIDRGLQDAVMQPSKNSYHPITNEAITDSSAVLSWHQVIGNVNVPIKKYDIGVHTQKIIIDEPKNMHNQQLIEQEPLICNAIDEEPQVLGQLHATYILVQTQDGLLLIDQHAAHERIMYERFASRFDETVTVPLLFAQIIPIAAHDMDLVSQYLTILKDHGVVAEPFGTDQLIIQAMPVYLKEAPLNDLIYQFVVWIKETDQTMPDFQQQLAHKLRAQMACKAAIKAGDTLTIQMAEQLIADLAKTPNKLTCPHGRPTEWLIHINEIERKFKRKL